MRFQKLKTAGQVAGVSNHNYRKKNTLNANAKIANKALVGSDNALNDLNQRYNTTRATKRKNGVLAYEFLLTASPIFFNDKSKLDKWTQKNIKWLESEFGKENLVNATLHLDERTPHIHAIVTPLKKNAKKKYTQSAKQFTGDKKKLSKLQDRYFESVKSLGLKRGIRGSTATHTYIDDFYNLVNEALNPNKDIEIPRLEIDFPPLFSLTQEKSEKYTKNQENIINNEVQTYAKPLYVSNTYAKQLKKERDTYKKTVLKLSEQADLVRDIELTEILEKLGYEIDTYDKNKWRHPADEKIISVENEKFFDFANDIGGGGSIDLVMYCLDCDFKQAVSYLIDEYNVDTATRCIVANTVNKAKNIVNSSKDTRYFEKPKPDEYGWKKAKNYLINERKIDENIIERAYNAGVLYNTKKEYKNYVFNNIVFLNNKKEPNLAEIKGTNQKFSGLAPGSKKTSLGFKINPLQKCDKVIFVESAIDALSYYEINNKPTNVCIISTAGGNVNNVKNFIKKHKQKTYICGFDNDNAGNKMYEAIKADYPYILRELPKNKDWNDDLKENKSYTPATAPTTQAYYEPSL